MGSIETIKKQFNYRLEEMKRLNKISLEARQRQLALSQDIEDCNRMYKYLKSMNESLQSKNLDYIEEIVKILELAVEHSVNSVLVMKKYKVTLDYIPYRNNGTLKLFFINEKGVKIPPKIIEGDMLNQVLSFSSIAHITHSMGYDTIYYDEAFASANIRSLQLINAVISYYTSLGMKFVFVSQNPVLYAGLERTMIELVSDGKQVTDVRATQVRPTAEEFETVARVTDLFDNITMLRE